MKIGYFPGCSLHATAREFDESLRAIAPTLDLDLTEIEDWACCGATSAHATNHLLSIALPARTLALAEAQQHQQVLAPCAACYNRLATAHHQVAKDAALAQKVNKVLERPFNNTVAVRSIAQILHELIPTIKSKVKTPLKDLKVACYYGCLLVRPPHLDNSDDAEQPHSLEEIVTATGATSVNWHKRLDCCGGGFSISRTDSVIRLSRAIIDDAAAAGADAIVVGCPMCQSNLDLRQRAMKRADSPIPILYITQLVGLALALSPKNLGLNRHFINTKAVSDRKFSNDTDVAKSAAGGQS
ncbi:MAG: CoB--CoM heterodisulfide reductase iron-sulfur subunit B family protein [Deltaproteobacteria bacterium]|nr:CoB--CoM heterodisulfide reductase iron-sulfur subunit B family protein [Deltaproteobacteria bacterium]